MRRFAMIALTLVATLALAACSGAATPAPPTSGGSAAPAASTAAACTESKTAGTVAVTMQNTAYSTTAVAATVGQVIAFTNKEGVQHTASLDDGPCTTATLNQGETDGLVFSAPGSYPFHCNIHPTTMKGTFTISS
ncbi:MAG TPA: cupredoxin domain-containing protein [Candidatus Limnocylindrales bacterium]|jgi:plastocyanin